ncbi:uncharacterized protein LOC134829065 [Culicoides brevitarsis]|uniref:uncharacterized protein LOC134829065 n=1 Tax=Culicoides brevitarsis TaxID=469753 RepID=UPI00307B91AF
MAPQNSTLIHHHHDDDDDLPSVATSERLATNMRDLVNNYSPILRPKSAGDRLSQYASSKPTVAGIYIPPSTQKKSIFTKNTKKTTYDDDDEENIESWYEGDNFADEDDDEQEIPIWIRGEPRFVSGITSTTTCNDVIAALINDEIQSGQYTKMDEVRYGVDDYVITERWRDVESELDGNEAILPIFLAWGEAQKEMKFKLKINKRKMLEGKVPEKKLEKKEKMTMVTKLMRRVLKQGDYIQKHLFVLKDDKKDVNRYTKKYNKQLFYENYLARNSNGTISSVVPSACSSIERLYCKCCGNGAKKSLKITDNLRVRPCPEPKMLENVSLEPLDDKLRAGDVFEDNVRTDDELLLVIENEDDSNEMFVDDTMIVGQVDNDSGNGSIGKNSENQSEKVAVEPISDYSSSSSASQEDKITATPKRKHRSLREYNELRKHSLNRHSFHVAEPLKFDEERFRKSNKNRSDKFDGLRFEIMLKMSEMKQLLVREEMLITQIQMQCARYRAENELYNSRQSVDELRVDEIQKNLEKFAQEIIDNEQELFATKLEVEQKAKIIQELKILLENGSSEEEIRKEKLLSKEKIEEKVEIEEIKEEKSQKEASPVVIRRRWSMERLEFIENIYEFCDNNKSVLI